MKYFPLVWATLWRKKLRTTLTVLSIVVAFFLYGILKTLDSTLSNPASGNSASMLVTVNKYSIGLPLPISALQQLRSVPGVKDATWFSVFGSYYQEPHNELPVIAIDADSYFKLYRDEVSVPPEVLAAFTRQRNSMLVGVDVARQYGWKVGDRVSVRSTMWPQEDGSQDWNFEIAGLMDGKEESTRASHAARILIHYGYFDEARAFGKGTVSWFMQTITSVARVAEISANIDAKFANSPSETSTRSAKEFTVMFLKQIGDISLIMRAILGAVFFTLLLMTGNTMMQSVRERADDIAVLKALGFNNALVMGLVVGEALLLCLIGAALGLGLSYLSLPAIEMSMQGISLSSRDLLPGLGFAVLLALVTSVPPGMRALRLNIVDALSGKH
jgi:putative ABC transport system permease protein